MRAALEAAWRVAREGYRETPPRDAPRPLRPLLDHARLTAAALEAIRRVLDDDEEFRGRVASAVTEETVGRAGWLFLTRPPGWEVELSALAAAEADDAEADRAAREERSAARRLRGAEEALRRTERILAETQAQVARAADELARERQARRVAESDAAAVRERLAAAEDELAQLRQAAPVAPPPASPAPSMPAEPRMVPIPTVPPGVKEAVDRAMDAMRAVQEALEAVPPSPQPAPVERRPPGSHPPRRHLAPLPPAVRDDTPEAAEHLVHVPGVLVLVDGYNASLAYRPDLPIAELRRRLVDALDELAARTGADVRVVFDGAEVSGDGPTTRVGGRRRSARVHFSAPDVEADDVILRMVDDTPASRAVVVASDDRRVQDGARERGANIISTSQLLAVLRRER